MAALCCGRNHFSSSLSTFLHGVRASVVLWVCTSQYVFVAVFRVLAQNCAFPFKFFSVACYASLLFLFSLGSFLYGTYARGDEPTTFSLRAVDFMKLHVPHCAYHLLTAMAIFNSYVTVPRYIVVMQTDYIFAALFSTCMLKRRVSLRQLAAAVVSVPPGW